MKAVINFVDKEFEIDSPIPRYLFIPTVIHNIVRFFQVLLSPLNRYSDRVKGLMRIAREASH
jgi:hypothetical protein